MLFTNHAFPGAFLFPFFTIGGYFEHDVVFKTSKSKNILTFNGSCYVLVQLCEAKISVIVILHLSSWIVLKPLMTHQHNNNVTLPWGIETARVTEMRRNFKACEIIWTTLKISFKPPSRCLDRKFRWETFSKFFARKHWWKRTIFQFKFKRRKVITGDDLFLWLHHA